MAAPSRAILSRSPCFAVGDGVPRPELVPNLPGELVEPLEREAALRGEGGTDGGGVQEPAHPLTDGGLQAISK